MDASNQSDEDRFLDLCDTQDISRESIDDVETEPASQCFHTRGAGFSQPLFENGRFKNPWKLGNPLKLSDLFKVFFCSKNESHIPRKPELDSSLPVVTPDMSQFDEAPISGVRHLWIGHATSLVQFDNVTFLTDPMFSERCSPVQFLGVKRYRAPACSVDDLPCRLDFVLISQSHYDHLDYNTVVALNQRYGSGLRWFVPQGLKPWLRSCGCVNVSEMCWWQEEEFSASLNVAVACTPSQHWSRRTGSDENKVLWCSWCVIGPRHSFFFCGDTGYCEAFSQIGRHYGPFTLANLPIGAYSPRSVMSPMQVDPVQSVQIHRDIKSEATIGIHWGTFPLSNEPYLEPRQLLEEEIRAKFMKPCDFFTVNHGEISLVGSDYFHEVD